MRNTLLTTVLTIFTLFTACKKDTDTKASSLRDKVIGTYEVTGSAYKYYSESGTATDKPGKIPVGTIYAFVEDAVQITNLNSRTTSGYYITYEKDKINTITISAGETYSETYVIQSISNSGLVFTKEKPFDTYVDGATTKTSQRSVLTLTLTKK